MNPVDELFHDKRPIEAMAFGAEAKPEEREEVAAQVRAMLKSTGVEVADDINRLGCTGMVKAGTIAAAKFLRLGLAGGGVGLPCFVPISRYCLVHETIGGLEPGQEQHHAEYVDAISRELTPEEHGRVELIRLAQERGRKDPDAAADVLSGRDESILEDKEPQTPDDLERQLYQARLAAGLQATAREQLEERMWKCSEHSEINWACRYCLAQAIVEGPLESLCFVSSGKPSPNEANADKQALGRVVIGSAVEEEIRVSDTRGDIKLDVYTRVATFTRKLSRS
jgi:hypothetical protein